MNFNFRYHRNLPVGIYSLGNFPLVYDMSMQVFPTAPSPTTTHLIIPSFIFSRFNFQSFKSSKHFYFELFLRLSIWWKIRSFRLTSNLFSRHKLFQPTRLNEPLPRFKQDNLYFSRFPHSFSLEILTKITRISLL